MEIPEESDSYYAKTVVINMLNVLKDLKKTIMNREMGDTVYTVCKKNQLKHVEVKTTISEMKISLDEINSMLDNAEENIS